MLLVQTDLERELALIVATNMPGKPGPDGGEPAEAEDEEEDDEEAEPT